MSAALQLNRIWAATSGSCALQPLAAAIEQIRRLQIDIDEPQPEVEEVEPVWAFYRKHTENLLRRYLYASMQVGRTPNLLGESVGRGWVSSRRVRTFEDALIFVLDVERCLRKITPLERQLISRVLIQEYTHSEAAAIMGISLRAITTKLPQAIDHLTAQLVHYKLLFVPD